MLGVTKRSEEYGDVGLAERPEPKPRAGTVVLRTAGAGICGTDLHIFKNEYKVAPPVVMGHEVCGFVEEVGEGVDPALHRQTIRLRDLFFDLRALRVLSFRAT